MSVRRPPPPLFPHCSAPPSPPPPRASHAPTPTIDRGGPICTDRGHSPRLHDDWSVRPLLICLSLFLPLRFLRSVAVDLSQWFFPSLSLSLPLSLPACMSHTPGIAFRHLPPRKDVVNQCLEFVCVGLSVVIVFSQCFSACLSRFLPLCLSLSVAILFSHCFSACLCVFLP